MNDETRTCPDCNANYLATDNYCRQCGMYVAALRVMPLVKSEPRLPAQVVRERAQLPAPVKKAATALAIGTALQIGAGIAGRYFAGQAARGAARGAVSAAGRGSRRGRKREQREVVPASSDIAPDTTAISETVLVRRVWIRRG